MGVSLCLWIPPHKLLSTWTDLYELGSYITTPEPISAAYYTYPSHKPVSVCVPYIVARQRLGKNVTMVTNTHATIEELLNVSFSMRYIAYQTKVGD
jgi:hypothetical protein